MNRSTLNTSSNNYIPYAGIDRLTTDNLTTHTVNMLSSIKARAGTLPTSKGSSENSHRTGFKEFDDETLSIRKQQQKPNVSMRQEPIRWNEGGKIAKASTNITSKIIEMPQPRSNFLTRPVDSGYPKAPSSVFSDDDFRRNKRQSTIYERNIEVFQEGDSFEFLDRREEGNRLQVHIIPFGRNRTYVRFNNDEMFDIFRIEMIENVESSKDRSAQSYNSSLCDSIIVTFLDKKKMIIEDCTLEMFSESLKRLGPYIEKRAEREHLNTIDSYGNNNGNNGGNTNTPKTRPRPKSTMGNMTSSNRNLDVKKGKKGDIENKKSKEKKESWIKRFFRH